MATSTRWVVLVAAMAGCGPDTSGITKLAGDAVAGEALYVAHCKRCHGPSAIEPATTAKRSADAAAARILTGDEPTMPSFASTLTNQEIADLIAYLKTR